MIEEPYRWVEAIANRREYIEHQLADGSPVVALSCAEGVLMVTLGRDRQKIFEIYDRIAMGGIGHPGDVERLRMAAIEVASTEGFTRSAADVSLRRLVNYSLSPSFKAAFEQIYGAPYLARLLFAELGHEGHPDVFIRLDYDGSTHTNGGGFAPVTESFVVLAGTTRVADLMSDFLRDRALGKPNLTTALDIAIDACVLGIWSRGAEERTGLPEGETFAAERAEQLTTRAIEAAVLDRSGSSAVTFRSLTGKEVGKLPGKR